MPSRSAGATCYGIDDRNVTPYGQVVRQQHAAGDSSTAWPNRRDYAERGERRRLRSTRRRGRTCTGLALTPVKFGITFTRRTLNQANALVNIFLDGTVQVSTGGTEMGQGAEHEDPAARRRPVRRSPSTRCA